MADEYREEPAEEPQLTASGADVEMGDDGAEAPENADSTELPFAEGGDEVPEIEQHIQFIDYLKSPMVTLLVGDGENSAILTAHQALLEQSPYFAEACTAFNDDGSPRQIELSNEEIDAVGCFLEYLYTGDYYPKKIPGTRELEHQPGIPAVDESGDQLLKHARVYTLAEKFGVDKLRSLATSKIHCVNSTAKGEIAYARYVYAYTDKDDTSIRAPVANFWATRSHTLRAEAEEEFRSICLEFPQFGYDVLTRVLDEKLKRQGQGKLLPSASSGGSGRKRARHSNI
ncbi:hypothetical protein PFICI_07960 [Pestalotiopsis fici W106-1]|uniref:BTB domain-containing protein n=1 Tax=Pestalotiopsis fici (strain W106-1 / CGMCC3.15140) TaxID=1229662 RepID=W3X5G4_PESFW|nr:uncharacterized protein PFICI_07960 [Pestalotiopsis fici W106-1]ETS80431.1 hypothetical protein PFICI_07960 [Pestalotiopsis fici W106-1]